MNESGGLIRQIELAADVVLTLVAFFLVASLEEILFAASPVKLTSTDYLLASLLIVIIWYVTLNVVNVKYGYGIVMTAPLVREIFKVIAIATIILVVCMYFFQIEALRPLLVPLFYLVNGILLVFSRWLIAKLVSAKRDDYFRRHLLIVGSRATAHDLIELIKKDVEKFKIIGCIETDPGDVGKDVTCGVKVIGTLDDLRSILLNEVVDEILIAMPLNEIENSDWYLSFMNTFGITIRIIPDWYIRKFMSKHAAHGFRVDRFLSEPALVISRVQTNQDALVVKAALDFILAALMLIVTAPLFIIIPIMIKLVSPGPVFYKQVRTGLDGRRFWLYKFRTMVPGAEELQYDLMHLNESDGPVFKIKDDPRVIPFVGRFLRRFGLDELPQFINVLRGEMSVVGPRPPTPQEVEKYELWQRRRLSMKPGITCIWQIQPNRNDIPFNKWVDMDMYYIDHWSLWLDAVIILKTVPAVLSGQGR